MTLRAVPSILGKRGYQELCGYPTRLPVLASPRRLPFAYGARLYATLQEDGRRDSGPPPGFDASQAKQSPNTSKPQSNSSDASSSASSTRPGSNSSNSTSSSKDHHDWEENPDLSISKFSELPTKDFGVNQHMIVNEEFKEALRQILWKFRAPIRYAFAYGSGVFPQSSGKVDGNSKLHPSPPDAISKVQGGNQKMIDFIFGVSYSQHWHSLNLQEHRDHYSALGSLGSYAVSKVQDSFGARVYFNPFVTVNGTLIKYGVVNLDTMCKDLSEWNTLYIAGRLQKPVKILRDNPAVRLANQVNLIAAVRTALLLLPEEFTEKELYATIAGISYMGDPRMTIGGDDPRKVENIVKHQLSNFRRLYAPLIENLPNISFTDSATSNQNWLDDPSVNAKLAQNMDPTTRGHMVRRLPGAFRKKLYFEYQSKFNIPRGEFNEMLENTKDEDPDRIRRREGGPFEQRIASDTEGGGLREEVRQVIESTIRWPSFTQSLKGPLTAGFARSWRYMKEKRDKAKKGAAAKKDEEKDKRS
ncbi:Mitochondrial translocator assembly and maintenance protein 41 [Elasticomyces elasticus]|uniref:Phosphatidate cytidylyltransferase, mitochondrial n=1 Tax=Exophiala sideris TaxID=1016849 RepID=A0ABR0JLL3_9EURO|nr:Mitochondrial translocator assembly and maintenance protein 41 [Elasticomyces elasticus]KAK5035419.1 Mitochondrial translocator assembly and maintenance protein 41 [Exophiala sideris]KAK5039229.1 Mitochondrial translocator assembly and maintenance protein 41 [Exophiala sideris]KAK5066344.1 Mitochondrial translocator assembly and maintenance protein 41 [Exophiala sideris]KAK5187021.1 Mitochondrial translocator assembly and maintenance protein 41 [Eurotiomycetes sp. CCFEE 6388]